MRFLQIEIEEYASATDSLLYLADKRELLLGRTQTTQEERRKKSGKLLDRALVLCRFILFHTVPLISSMKTIFQKTSIRF